MSSPIDLLAFSPHPDDVELFCGGLLASAAAQGARVVVVDLTRGERATRGTVEGRAAEAAAAAQALGVAARENLGLPDAGLDGATGVERLVETIRRLRPELVVAPWEEERHPDHAAACALVERAVFLAGLAKYDGLAKYEGIAADPNVTNPYTVPRVLHYPMRRIATPSFIVDVTAVYARKRAAIACHKSQVSSAELGPKTLVGSPLSLSAGEARDAFYGAQIGTAFGEPYVMREAVPIADPLDHFRRHAAQPPLFFPERR